MKDESFPKAIFLSALCQMLSEAASVWPAYGAIIPDFTFIHPEIEKFSSAIRKIILASTFLDIPAIKKAPAKYFLHAEMADASDEMAPSSVEEV